jgi:regulator of protease activity HflC (stomatin/prohibitin superfamily)
MIRERERKALNGIAALILMFAIYGLVAWMLWRSQGRDAWMIGGAVFIALINTLCLGGLFVVNPNEAQVLQLFGNYAGTVKGAGLRWANPFFTKKKISQRIRNFESSKLKVNEADGSPIEIAAVVVWRVVDTAEAAFEVDDYQNFVTVQSEAALRNLATQFPYDDHGETRKSLRGNTADIAAQLKAEIQERLAKAGVEVLEARISHLAYAAEIAAAMLRRQQASAIVSARQKIVEGAVGMVEMALDQLAAKKVVDFDGDRKAAMVSNLLVVLCGDHEAQPVLNTGSIYH